MLTVSIFNWVHFLNKTNTPMNTLGKELAELSRRRDEEQAIQSAAWKKQWHEDQKAAQLSAAEAVTKELPEKIREAHSQGQTEIMVIDCTENRPGALMTLIHEWLRDQEIGSKYISYETKPGSWDDIGCLEEPEYTTKLFATW